MKMKIMVFLHGTTIMHKSGLGKPPRERAKQVVENDPSIHEYESYVPISKANEKIKRWVEQGAEIVYLSSHQIEDDVKKDIQVLATFDFPDAPVLYRRGNETYAQIAERVMPDILVEDDCESIGGEIEMTYSHVSPQKRKLMKSIVVKEFTGLDCLPDNLVDLKNGCLPTNCRP
jgi:hypothetical protein